MPIQSRIEPHLVHIIVRGSVTAEEILAEQARLRSSPGFAPDLPQLIDALHVTGSTVDGPQMRRIAAQTVFSPGADGECVSASVRECGGRPVARTFRACTRSAWIYVGD